jgi:predicted DsbA family dithiol-disulfide isomerase
MQNISIEIISDIVCPWCYVGLGHLRRAIALTEGRSPGSSQQIQIRWSPYMLNPHLPVEGVSRRDYLVGKFGTPTPGYFSSVQAAALAVGLPLHLDRIQTHPNTLGAHMLVAAAGDQAHAMTDRLFEAFFVEGQNLAARETLLKLAESVGIDQHRAEAILNDPLLAKRVAHIAHEWQEHGVSGVPKFVLSAQGRQQVLPGAVSATVLLEAFCALGGL